MLLSEAVKTCLFVLPVWHRLTCPCLRTSMLARSGNDGFNSNFHRALETYLLSPRAETGLVASLTTRFITCLEGNAAASLFPHPGKQRGGGVLPRVFFPRPHRRPEGPRPPPVPQPRAGRLTALSRLAASRSPRAQRKALTQQSRSSPRRPGGGGEGRVAPLRHAGDRRPRPAGLRGRALRGRLPGGAGRSGASRRGVGRPGGASGR